MPTIDDIITLCEENFNFQVNDENRGKYRSFLERQLQAHHRYDLNSKVRGGCGFSKYHYVNLLVSKLLLLSYMLGETPITSDKEGTQSRIGRDENGDLKALEQRVRDLNLLSPKEMGVYKPPIYHYQDNMTDLQLYHLFSRVDRRGEGWSTSINELGRDKIIVEYFGRAVSYNDVTPYSRKNKNR